MEFHVCHCGNKKENHNFRHSYEDRVKVTFTENTYTINADDYPSVKITDLCGQPQCNRIKILHDGKMILHDFVPSEKTTKKINFVIPYESICLACSKTMKEHLENEYRLRDASSLENSKDNHPFKIKIEIENFKDEYTANITDPDNGDIKINWK